MSCGPLPLVIEPDALRHALGRDDLLVVDLSLSYDQGHIPGAVHVDYNCVIQPQPPITGLLPDRERLEALCLSLGLRTDIQVVVCDDEGGGRAARLLWTLQVVGHRHCSFLNGGLTAWRALRHPITTQPTATEPSPYTIHINDSLIADKDYLLARLQDPEVVIVDCRTAEDYSGKNAAAQRAGHIPGAINIDWSRSQDPQHHLRLRPAPALRDLYQGAGVTPDKEIITYCHSHRRSAHTYLVLQSLGYPRVRGYAGSWSEWGNDPRLPVERSG